jgi:hypothetical protein
MVDRMFGFADKNPGVLTTALANAHKFVPERVTNVGHGSGTDSLMGAASILGDLLSPAPPRAAPPSAPSAAAAPAAAATPAPARPAR